MENKFTNIIESLKKTDLRDLIYLVIVIVFLVIVAVIFFLSTRFMTDNMNKIFSLDQDGASPSLDTTRYLLVIKKLNIPTGTGYPSSPQAQNVVSSSASPTILKPSGTLDKKALSITILNSTGKRGIAATLAKKLGSAGFSTPKTGNQRKLSATTTITIKESKHEYLSSILETVRGIYPDAIATTTRGNMVSDAVVIIGTH